MPGVPEDHNNSKTVETWLGRLSAIGHSVKDTDPPARDTSSGRVWTCIFSITLCHEP